MVINLGNNTDTGWQRPSNWLAQPVINASDKGIWLLTTVKENGQNYISFTVADAYTVDFGDGNVINYSANSQCFYDIQYATVPNSLGAGTTDKQCWVKVSPQGSGNITRFNPIVKTTTTNYTCCQNVVEVLVGSLSLQNSANMFNISSFRNCKSVKFYAKLTFVNTMYRTFYECFSLENIEGEIEAQSNCDQIFSYCYSLPHLNNLLFTNAGTAISSISTSSSIKSLSFTSTFKPTNCQSFISVCYSIKSIKLDITNVTSFNSFAYTAKNLSNFDILAGDGSTISTFQQAFYQCDFEQTPALNLIGSTNNANMFYENSRLRKSNLTNIKASISFYGCNLSHAAILDIFQNQLLAVAATQTIDLRRNPDVANLPAATIAIATAKNWSAQII
jgi:hypothetical protein